jgi:hypothetical protein
MNKYLNYIIWMTFIGLSMVLFTIIGWWILLIDTIIIILYIGRNRDYTPKGEFD